MSVLDLSFAFYASAMPDAPGPADVATMVRWAGQGICRLGPSGVEFCARRLMRADEPGKVTSREAVYGWHIPERAGVTASETRRTSAVELARALYRTPGFDRLPRITELGDLRHAVRQLAAGQPGMRQAA
jgi:hypothetical protein